MNQYYDVIVIGASQEGRTVAKAIAAKLDKKHSIAMLSASFHTKDAALNKSSVTKIIGTAKFLTYNHGLTGIVYNNESLPSLFCRYLVLAMGTKSSDLLCSGSNTEGIYFALSDIPYTAVNNCVIFGNTKKAIKLATKASQRFTKVVFCPNGAYLSKEIVADIERLSATKNIQVTPIDGPMEIKSTDGKVSGIRLGGSFIPCEAILVSMNALPDTSWVPSTLFPSDENGFLQVTDKLQSIRIPTLYACGEIIKDFNRAKLETIISDIIGGLK